MEDSMKIGVNFRLMILFLAIWILAGSAFKNNAWAQQAIQDNTKVDIITAVPRTMTFQGEIRGPDEEPWPPDSFFDVTFRIFPSESGGTELWSDIVGVTTGQNGRISAELTNLNIPFDQDYWLELEIDSEILTPRYKLSMAAYAAVSDESDHSVDADHTADSDLLQGHPAIDFANAIHNHDTEYVNEGEPNSITSVMIVDGEIEFSDIGPNGALPGQVMKWDGASWIADDDQSGGANGWVDDGITVSLENPTERVSIGAPPSSYKLDVAGDIRSQGNLLVDFDATIGDNLEANRIAVNQFWLAGGLSNYVLTSDIAGNGTWQPFNGLQGSGTLNYLSKYIGPNILGNSMVYDNGTFVGIGTPAPTATLDVSGMIRSRIGLLVDGSASIGDMIDANGIVVSQFQLMGGAAPWYVLTSDINGYGTWQPFQGVRGAGSTNYIPKFTDFDEVGTSQIFDDGANVGIGTLTPTAKLDVMGDSRLQGNVIIDGSAVVADAFDANSITTSQFQMMLGGSNGYVLTSDASGNGTWQPLPFRISGDTDKIDSIDSRIEELTNLVNSQAEQIRRLETRIADLEGSGR